jgi:hypothetical protein
MFSPQPSPGDKGPLAHAVKAKTLLLSNDQCLEFVGHNLVSFALLPYFQLLTYKLYFVRNRPSAIPN